MQIKLLLRMTKVLQQVLIIGLSVGSCAFAATENSTSLADLVQKGLRNSFAIHTQQHQHQIRESARLSSWMALLPSVSLNAGRTSQVAESLESEERLKTGTTGNTLSATASWTLWNNWTNFRSIQSKGLQRDSSLIESEQVLQNQVIQIINAYLSYLVLIERESILKDLLEQSVWAQEQAALLVDLGARTRLDVLEAEIEVKSTQLSLFEAQRSLPNALNQLKFLVNSEESELFQAVPIQAIKPYFQKSFDENLARIRQLSRDQFERLSPDLESARLQVEVARLDFLESRASYFPNTSVSFSFVRDLNGYVKEHPAVGERASFDTWSVSLGLSWTLWDWLNTHRTIEAQRRSLEITRIGYREKLHAKSNEMQNLLDQYEANEKSIEASRLLLTRAKEQQEYSSELYKLGKRTMIEVQKANTSYSRAQLDLNERLKTRYITMAQIMQLSNQSLRPPGYEMNWTVSID